MKNFLFKCLIPLLTFTVMASVVSSPIAEKADVHPVAVTLTIVAAAFVYQLCSGERTQGITYMGVENEIWANYIIQRLWKQNPFLAHAFSDDDKVLAGKIVHIPNPGSKPTVRKNREMFPAIAVRRTDTDIVYTLDEYTTDPTHIQDAEKVELTYDKIDSVYGDHSGSLVEEVANDIIIKWLSGIPNTSIYRTTGANTADMLANLTGTRKVVKADDLKKFQRLFDNANVPDNDRKAMFSGNMLDELTSDLTQTQYRDFSREYDAANGVIGRLYGFDIMKRSTVATVKDTAGTLDVLPYGAVNGAADFDCALIWQKDCVARALGEVKFFENVDRAEYYGDVYSALLRMGGRRRRADNLGVGALVQATGV